MRRKEFVGFEDLNLFLFGIEKFHSIDSLKTVNLAKNCPVFVEIPQDGLFSHLESVVVNVLE